MTALRKRFDTRCWRHPFHALPKIENDGLVLGRGTVLARMAMRRSGETCLAVETDQERLLALLSATYGRQVDPSVMKQIDRASTKWQRGDKAGAHIELAFACFPRLRSDDDAFHLFVADDLLAQGMTPRRLVRELGFDEALLKYDPNQTRVPAGSGRASGRWGSDGGGSADAPSTSSAPTASSATQALLGVPAAAGNTAVQSFLADATPAVIRALTAFASRFSVPTAIFGALFIPTPNSGGVTRGTLPDAPDISFKLDGPVGNLYLTSRPADGTNVTVTAQIQRGSYVDIATDKPIGRDLNGHLYLDSDAVHDAVDTAREKAGLEPIAKPDAKDDNPKLCPKPEKDTPHGSSDRAKDYEDDVHARANPSAPTPRGFGVNFIDPLTGRKVFFEDCFRYTGDLVDGDMRKGDLAEAKGPGYEWRPCRQGTADE